MQTYTGNTDVIAGLGTTPEQRGLTADEFKAKFDKGLTDFVTWFNETHGTEFDAHIADSVTDTDGVHGLKIDENTWTPTLVGSTVAGANTYSVQNGQYYKIGKQIHFSAVIGLATKDAAMAGNVSIAGLPFASKNVANYVSSCAIGYFQNLDLDATRPYLSARISLNSQAIRIFKLGDNVTASDVDASQITGTTSIYISGTYITA